MHRKLAYYFVKNAFEPIAVFCVKKEDMIEFIVTNETTADVIIKLKIQRMGTKTGDLEIVREIKKVIAANKTKVFFRLPESKNMQEFGSEIIIASLYNLNSHLLSRNYYNYKRWKHINLPEANPHINLEDDNKYLQLSSDKPVFFLSIFHSKVDFSRNCLIILPGEVVQIKKLGDQKITLDEIKMYNLNQYLST